MTEKIVGLCIAALALTVGAAEVQKKPLGSEAALKPLARHVIAPRRMIDLGGEWDFAQVGEKGAKISVWGKVVIPWGMESMSSRDIHYFRRFVDLPDDVSGKRVLFKAERILDTYSLIINGTRFPAATTFEMPWENDITSAVKPGRNEIIVEVTNDFGRRDPNDALYPYPWSLRGYWGISRPVHLEIMSPISIDSVVVQTKVMPEKIFTVKTTVTNATDTATSVRLTAQIGENVESEDCRVSPAMTLLKVESDVVVIPAKGAKEIVLEKKWPDAKLWDPEHPNLYDAAFHLSALNSRHLLDAYRQRFGFREIAIKGHQFLVNGKPYIHRRTSHPFPTDDRTPDETVLTNQLATLRACGVTGLRLTGREWLRWIDVADRYGAFITPVPPIGTKAARKTDKFWKILPFYYTKMIKAVINNPSVFAWGLGCEFGTVYGGDEGGPLEKATQEKQVACARVAEELDPTRAWTFCGEIDVSYPAKGTVGPAPIRSFHYPIATASDGVTFPESAYWYAKGHLSWHRISTKDKPLVISEDLYHGTIDNVVSMAKVGGDSVYGMEGYAKTLHTITRALVDGYYFSGLGGWETFGTFQSRGDKNFLNRLGPLMPNYHIATRENFPNLRGGEQAVRNVYCYNQLFTPYDCELVREDWFEGKKVFEETRKFPLDQGERHHEKIVIDAPRVMKPGKYEVRFKLVGRNPVIPGSRTFNYQPTTNNYQLLTTRTYTYTVFPKKTKIAAKGKTALLASADSVLRTAKFPHGVFDTAGAALASGAKAIVVDKVLTSKEGRALNDFVWAGGRVLLVEAQEKSWTPLMIEFRRPMSFVWRRNDDRMRTMNQDWLKAWMPDHTLGDSSYPKPTADARILWDCGQKDGLTNANILWVNRGKGAWFLCQLPVLSRFAVEPAAPFVLQAVMDEFAVGVKELTGRAVCAAGSTAAELLASLKIEADHRAPTKGDVLMVDASRGLDAAQCAALNAHAAGHGTTLLLEPQPGTNTEFLAELGIRLLPFEKTFTVINGNRHQTDGTPKWLRRKDNSGLLAGLTTEDTFWRSSRSVDLYMRRMMFDEPNPWFTTGEPSPAVTGRMEIQPGKKVKVLTDPAGIVVCPYRKGKVIVVTLRFSALAAAYPQRAGRLLRTLLNNLGVKTVTPERVHDYRFIDISSVFNRGLWNDPVYRKPDGSFDPVGWFGTENDMRFFPVNLCGWSMAARNHCPKDPFPTEPMNLGGVKFLLADPAKHKGRGCLVLEPGTSVRIKLPDGLKAQKFYFLGAQGGTGKGPILEMRLPTVEKPVVFNGGNEHFGMYRWAVAVKKGTVAWSGETLKDDCASLYNWFGENAVPEKVVTWMELENVGTKDPVAIIAVTAELTTPAR